MSALRANGSLVLVQAVRLRAGAEAELGSFPGALGEAPSSRCPQLGLGGLGRAAEAKPSELPAARHAALSK